MKKLLGSLVVASAVTFAAEASAAGTTETFTIRGRSVDLYVPSTPQAKAPLVLMLHGCSQTAQDFETATRMNALAETQGFYVAWPTQPSSKNIGQCWNWFDTANQARGAGEPDDLVAVVLEAENRHTIDPDHVYAAGLSAGAAMTAILGATYPDVFAAIAVGSGLEYQAALNVSGGLAAQKSGGPDPLAQGDAIFEAMGTNARPMPVIVFHGTADGTVAVVNGHQVLASYARANADALGLSALAAATTATSQADAGRSYSTETTNGPDGQPLLEGVFVTGMNHAWSGGAQGASYTDSTGPDATALAWAFFAAHPRTTPTGIVAPDGGVISKGDGGSSGGGPAGGGADGGSASDGGSGSGAGPDGSSGGGGGGCGIAHGASELPFAIVLPALAALAARRRRRGA